MACRTYTDLGGVTVWLDEEYCVDVWAETLEHRADQDKLYAGGRFQMPTYTKESAPKLAQGRTNKRH